VVDDTDGRRPRDALDDDDGDGAAVADPDPRRLHARPSRHGDADALFSEADHGDASVMKRTTPDATPSLIPTTPTTPPPIGGAAHPTASVSHFANAAAQPAAVAPKDGDNEGGDEHVAAGAEHDGNPSRRAESNDDVRGDGREQSAATTESESRGQAESDVSVTHGLSLAPLLFGGRDPMAAGRAQELRPLLGAPLGHAAAVADTGTFCDEEAPAVEQLFAALCDPQKDVAFAFTIARDITLPALERLANDADVTAVQVRTAFVDASIVGLLLADRVYCDARGDRARVPELLDADDAWDTLCRVVSCAKRFTGLHPGHPVTCRHPGTVGAFGFITVLMEWCLADAEQFIPCPCTTQPKPCPQCEERYRISGVKTMDDTLVATHSQLPPQDGGDMPAACDLAQLSVTAAARMIAAMLALSIAPGWLVSRAADVDVKRILDATDVTAEMALVAPGLAALKRAIYLSLRQRPSRNA